MTLELWLAWAAATAAFMLIPGPTILVVAGYALGRGRRSAWATVPGTLAGDVAAMTASFVGVGALLAASPAFFRVLTLVGAGVAVALGVRMWRAASRPDLQARSGSARAMFLDSFVVTALNPKSILFFVAFLPQFLDPDRSLPVQFALMTGTFLILGGFTLAVWILLAAGLRARLRNPAAARAANRVGASLLVGAGLGAALLRQSH